MGEIAKEVKILVPGDQSMVALLGQRDEFLKLVEAAFDSHILVRGNEITITGEAVEAGLRVADPIRYRIRVRFIFASASSGMHRCSRRDGSE